MTKIKATISTPPHSVSMYQCIESMMREHEQIVAVLASLQAMAERLAAGASVPRQDVADFGRFFRDFADKCHHGKEEDRLFSKMVQAGFPHDSGPIAVMLAEHDAGRQEVCGLLEVGAGSGPLTEAERARTLDYAGQFVPLLFSHIQKENNILYPMAQNAVPPEEFELLDQSCAAFDEDIRALLDVPGLRALAADLMHRYPAAPTALMAYAGCGAYHSAT